MCVYGALNDRDLNVACNIRNFALAGVLGISVTVKRALIRISISVGAIAKGEGSSPHEPVEAPSIIALAV